ncbi:hypothetical protein [Salidesulfovibrio brasiliensis]|uniref:hypothetical protein n=1 Tax=Salidesulfovibrio brasiliensis TaxID=221711 RepID=UPI0006D22F88|nr:hypothetical protein [Salidesulfovibrio brasiliensis]
MTVGHRLIRILVATLPLLVLSLNALAADMNDLHASCAKASLAFEEDRFKDTLKYASQCLGDDQTPPEVKGAMYLVRGSANVNLDDAEAAVVDFSRAAELCPDPSNALMGRAMT